MYAGAGTSVPLPSACQESRCRCHQDAVLTGTGDSAPPLMEPKASRAATTESTIASTSVRATGLVRKRTSIPLSVSRSSSSSWPGSVLLLTEAEPGVGSDPDASLAARRRSATSAAWLVAADAKSLKKSSPCRYGSQAGASRGRTSADVPDRRAARARRPSRSWPGRPHTDNTAASSSSASPTERTAKNPSIRSSEPKNNRTNCHGKRNVETLASDVNSAARRSW